jgi:hypothetical protein
MARHPSSFPRTKMISAERPTLDAGKSLKPKRLGIAAHRLQYVIHLWEGMRRRWVWDQHQEVIAEDETFRLLSPPGRASGIGEEAA